MSTVWTLLITDDCQEDREIYRAYLSGDPQQSYQFIEAGSAEVGLALCQRQHCDAILLDFRLPDMTGLEFLDELSQFSNPPLPVIMVTGQGDETVAVQAIKRGAQDYLVKDNLAPDALQLAVRNVIQEFYLHHPNISRKTQPLSFDPDEKLIETLQALQVEKQLSAVKTQLVATVSHEYRTPLAAILAAASTLKMHGNKLQPAKQEKFLTLIESKARYMTQLVNDLLELETFEAGQASFTPMPFELLQFVSDLLDEQRQHMSDRYELTLTITGNTKGFWGDQKLLRLMLINLISYAMQSLPNGGSIETQLSGDQFHVELIVKDDGMGISEKEQAQLFQLLQCDTRKGLMAGSGRLGLAIVKACVDLHGGQLSVKSQVGQGTQFRIELPKQSPEYANMLLPA
jgi:signal transduction histidine kinase